jgi:hypothetical protein
MSNLEKYQNVFVSCFDLESPNFGQLVYQSISAWDSLGHMSLITELETAFNIMMDMDDVNCKTLNLDPIQHCLTRTDWDGLSFNTYPHYYDIWALSIWPYCFSYNHFNNNYQYHGIIRDHVMRKLAKLKPGELLPCISSFNGFSIYRTNKFLNTYYDGRVRADLFPPEFISIHAQAQKSRGLVYRNYGHIKGRYEDCEHRAFHQMARKNSQAKIRICRGILFY